MKAYNKGDMDEINKWKTNKATPRHQSSSSRQNIQSGQRNTRSKLNLDPILNLDSISTLESQSSSNQYSELALNLILNSDPISISLRNSDSRVKNVLNPTTRTSKMERIPMQNVEKTRVNKTNNQQGQERSSRIGWVSNNFILFYYFILSLTF